MLHLEVCFFLLFLGSAQGQQQVVPCLTSQASCSAVTSGISMINNNVFCCSAGFSMSWVNNVCSCRKISDVFPCLSDPQRCRFADSFSTDGNGKHPLLPPRHLHVLIRAVHQRSLHQHLQLRAPSILQCRGVQAAHARMAASVRQQNGCLPEQLAAVPGQLVPQSGNCRPLRTQRC